MTTLVTGGAGYIGSQFAWSLTDSGAPFVVLDNLSTGVRGLLPPQATLVEGDVRDRGLLRRLLSDFGVTDVVHFAGSVSVTESMERPELYYSNNTAAVGILVEACAEARVKRFVFSSTAAVYGTPDHPAVTESHPTRPESPYGHSKLLSEEIIRNSGPAAGMDYVILRYFNVAGADPLGRTGQSNPASAHLIINALRAARGALQGLQVFGSDYDTVDGTGVRDFIHVADLVDAHVDALAYLRRGGASGVFNCGYGRGFSVLEVADMVRQVTGAEFAVEMAPRRPGDIAAIMADASAARRALGWTPRLEDLESIIRHAWDWETRPRSGAATSSRPLAASLDQGLDVN